MVRSARPSPFRISAGFVEDRRWNRDGTGRVDSTRNQEMRGERGEGGGGGEGGIEGEKCGWHGRKADWLLPRMHRPRLMLSGGISPVGLRYVSTRSKASASIGDLSRPAGVHDETKETANSSSSGSSSPLIRSRNYRPRDERIARRLRTIAASKRQWSSVTRVVTRASQMERILITLGGTLTSSAKRDYPRIITSSSTGWFCDTGDLFLAVRYLLQKIRRSLGIGIMGVYTCFDVPWWPCRSLNTSSNLIDLHSFSICTFIL